MLLADLAATSAAVAATSSRRAKVELITAALRRAAAEPGPAAAEVGLAVHYLAGELRQRRTGIGYAALRARPAPATEPSLRLADVDDAFARMAELSGTGSAARRREALGRLLSRATAAEQSFLVGLVSGELRQGALDGVMLDAVRRAADLPETDVRRAVMVAGSVPPVAAAALADGAAGLARFRLTVGRPLRPMLAASAADVAAAAARLGGPAAWEYKLDGVRIQVHRQGGEVRVFTRTLEEIGARVPEVVAAVRALPCESAVLDGEVIALDSAGRPRPFQVTAGRVATRGALPSTPVPLTPFFFDLLHLDGSDLLAVAAERRWESLAALLPPGLAVPRLVTDDVEQAAAFFDEAVHRGHEGVVAKALAAPYDAGRRGASWVKVKPRHTLDLVVLAAEWGHGRRTGLLSNLHLGARDAPVSGAEAGDGPAPGGGPGSGAGATHDGPERFVMLGKTFKGLTDQMLAWQTERLLALATRQDRWVVHVRPELVVEVAFDGVQTSPRYPGGMALRFARVLRHRPDKPATEADTVQTVRALHRREQRPGQ